MFEDMALLNECVYARPFVRWRDQKIVPDPKNLYIDSCWDRVINLSRRYRRSCL